MHKKMEKNVAHKMVLDVLYAQGLNVIEVSDVLRRLDKQKSIRTYMLANIVSKCFVCDNELTQNYRAKVAGGRDVVDGCLVALKNSAGEIQFGVSSIHPNDLSIAPSKQVTGMVAAVKAELAPCDIIPRKFRYVLFGNEHNTPELGESSIFVQHGFLRRCFEYFNVKSISFKVCGWTKVAESYTFTKEADGSILCRELNGVIFKEKTTIKKTKKDVVAKICNLKKSNVKVAVGK